MPDLRHSISIAAPPQAIYPLFSGAAGLREWWAADVLEDDGVLDLGFFSRATSYCLRPVSMHEPLTAQWLCESGKEWGGTLLLFSLESSGAQTKLRFSHKGWEAETDYFIDCNTTWGGLMFRLKAAAEGRAPGPLFTPTGMAV